FEEGLRREIAAVMAVLLVMSRVAFHYMPFVMPDLVAMGMIAAMVFYCKRLADRERKTDALVTGCCLGLAVSTKHYLAPMCIAPTIYLMMEWVKREDGRTRIKPQMKQIYWLMMIAASSAALFLLLHRVAFWLVPEFRHQSLFDLIRLIFTVG